MPRRKYGHMVGPCPKTPIEKCNLCRLGYYCPIHKSQLRPDYKILRKKKKQHFSGKIFKL